MNRILIPLFLAGCSSSHFEPASYVADPRLLTVVAEPPELAAGQKTILTATAVDPQGMARALSYHWSICTAERGAGSGLVEESCITDPSVLEPIGDGDDLPFTMPMLDVTKLGLPDSSAGFYLPVRLDFAAGDAKIVAFYRLRYSLGLLPPNQNPVISEIAGVAIQDVNGEVSKMPPPQPFDERTPIEVGVRDGVRLQAHLADGSAESYLIPDGTMQTKMVTEQLRVVWLSTAGSFSQQVTGLQKPDTIFRLDDHLPDPGALIDLWVVVTDERGGQAIAHRSLLRR